MAGSRVYGCACFQSGRTVLLIQARRLDDAWPWNRPNNPQTKVMCVSGGQTLMGSPQERARVCVRVFWGFWQAVGPG